MLFPKNSKYNDKTKYTFLNPILYINLAKNRYQKNFSSSEDFYKSDEQI